MGAALSSAREKFFGDADKRRRRIAIGLLAIASAVFATFAMYIAFRYLSRGRLPETTYQAMSDPAYALPSYATTAQR